MNTFRLLLVSLVLCGFAYTASIHGFARIIHPEGAGGSLVIDEQGHVIGSRMIAQAFTSKRYFHPRPSACGYDARAAAGSNLSPNHPKLTERARNILATLPVGRDHPVPADLVTASGSGLDPDITEEAARFQVPRIAEARQIEPARVDKVIDETRRPLMGRFGGPMLVNVLEVNLALDRISP